MGLGALGVRLLRAIRLCGMLSFGLVLLAAPAHAAFPGHNGKIAFDAPRDGAVDTIDQDGTGRALLVNGGGEPSWSSDGARIAYTGFDLSNPRLNGIYVANADGTGATRIVPGSGNESPTWSPDQRIAFIKVLGCVALDCLDNQLWTVNADGSGPAQLKGSKVTNPNDPHWSPDGAWIAFGDRSNPPFSFDEGMFLVSPDGSQTRQPSTSAFIPLSWAPGGSRILFESSAGLMTVMTDGSGSAPLPGWTPGQLVSSASYSPDGSKIVVSYKPGCQFQCQNDLFVMNADGSDQVNITNTPDANEISPDWQPLPGPQRGDYRNGAQFCKAEREFLGEEAFRKKYGTNGNGANAYGKCVSESH